MMNRLLTFLLLLAVQSAAAQTWYVSGKGDDANSGKTPQAAFRTLQKAADLVQPGDVVLIGNGTYANPPGTGQPVLSISRSGRADAWITWKAQPGQQPDIRPTGWAGIQITGSYHVLDGLTVTGANDSLVLLHALEDAKKPKPDPRFNSNGIIIEGRREPADRKPHHVVIRRCQISKCPGGGISALETDYLTVEDCLVFENAWYMRYAGSGITTLNNWAFDDKPGYHIVIQRNYVWNNKTLVPWERTGKLSDGNGILLDVTDLSQQGATNPNADNAVKPETARKDSTQPKAAPKPQRPEWKGRALIANNVSAFNGGSGIHTFRTRHVDIINNTTYWNGQVVGYQELFPNRSDDIVILNNIIVPHPGGQVTSDNRNTNIQWDYNLYPTAQRVFVGPNDRIADPLFVDVKPDLRKANFRLMKTSPGHNSGSDRLLLTTDITGKPRPKTPDRDRGAFEQ